VLPSEKPRNYQVVGAKRLKQGSCILADDMGLGKTLTVTLALLTRPEPYVLVIGLKSALSAWLGEMHKWAPGKFEVFVLTGNKAERTEVLGQWARRPNAGKRHVLLANYAQLSRDDRLFLYKVPLVIFDEAHYVRSRRAPTYEKMCRLTRNAKCVYPVTGSPLAGDVSNLWTLLHLVAPDKFRSYWAFMNKYTNRSEGYFAQEFTGVKNEQELRATLGKFMIRRTRKQVAPEMPPKQRIMEWVDLDEDQQKVYPHLKDSLKWELDENQIVTAPTVLAALTRLRQLLAFPPLVGGRSEGGAMKRLAEMCKGLPRGARFVIYSPFRRAIEHAQLMLVLNGTVEEKNCFFFTGGMEPNEVLNAQRAFNAPGDEVRAAFGTIDFGVGYSLNTAGYVFFIGLHWDPTKNWQAEDRAYRMNSTGPVLVYYLVYRCETDEHVVELLEGKIHDIRAVYGYDDAAARERNVRALHSGREAECGEGPP
jgi:SNF2 family DNA or RNA helicase